MNWLLFIFANIALIGGIIAVSVWLGCKTYSTRFMDATETPAKISESAQTLLRLFKREGEEMSKRVVFTFEPESLAALEKIQADGGYDTLAATVKDALQILWAIQREAKKGYSELIVRNPKTDGEKVVLDYETSGGNG